MCAKSRAHMASGVSKERERERDGTQEEETTSLYQPPQLVVGCWCLVLTHKEKGYGESS